MQHFHPLGFGVAYRRKDDRLNRTQYYTVVAELTLGPLSIPTPRDALVILSLIIYYFSNHPKPLLNRT